MQCDILVTSLWEIVWHGVCVHVCVTGMRTQSRRMLKASFIFLLTEDCFNQKYNRYFCTEQKVFKLTLSSQQQHIIDNTDRING